MTCPECQFPMVWSLWHEQFQCAVYGRHRNAWEEIERDGVVTLRNRQAEFAGLIELCLEPGDDEGYVTPRERRRALHHRRLARLRGAA